MAVPVDMDKDKAAILKIAAAFVLIIVFLVAWFLTIGAPAGEDEEAAVDALIDAGRAAAPWSPIR